nr:65-kda microtubule-associated protein 7 [Quercus suber]
MLYVSALSEEAGQANLQSAVSSGWPASLHLIGKQIWNDINFGESEADKDHTLLELERECLEVYRPKVEEAANAKARLHSLLQPKKLNLPLSWLNTSIRILGLLWTCCGIGISDSDGGNQHCVKAPHHLELQEED